ncbi:MAG: zf-HC2 domain-containing protein [Planctomycetota bacterium]|nr:zf-HC2 domain-containing protein [Planctomycetota bacterium]
MSANLTCNEARGLLRPYLEGEMSPGAAALLEGHLAGCTGCADQLQAHREVFSLLERTYAPRRLGEAFDRAASVKLQQRRSTGNQEAVAAAGAAILEAPARRPSQRAMEPASRLAEAPAEPAALAPAAEPVEERAQAAPAGFLESLAKHFGAAPWWCISGAFHALLLLLLTLVGMALLKAQEESVVITTDLLKQKDPPEPDPQTARDIFRKPVPVETNEPVTVEQPMVVHEEVEIADHAETANESDLNSARGEEGLADAMLGGTGSVAALGLGGGGGGAYGQRMGGGRKRMAIRGGGGAATESAVDAALAWLARHQEKEGFWDTDKYLDNKQFRYGGSTGMSALYDPGISGMGLLAFLGAGHTLRVGKYKQNVQAGIQWLLSVQGPDGDFTAKFKGHKAVQYYCHCIATLACAEALAMNGGRDWGEYNEQGGAAGLKDALQKAIDLILAWQKENTTGGWTYYGPTVCDPTVTGWAVMALKSAKTAGIHIPPESFQQASEALRKITTVNEKQGDYGHALTGYLRPGSMPFASKGYACTAAMAVTQLFLGADRQEARIDAAVEFFTQADALPQWIFKPQDPGTDHQNLYYWYYGTLASFQAGGEAWTKWNESMKKALLPHQRQDNLRDGSPQDVDGSWDPDDVWGAWGGRVYSTALGALCLEVYYRYLPLYR